MCTCSGSRIPINGQINIHVSVSEEHYARGQAQALWRFLAKKGVVQPFKRNAEEDFDCFFVFFLQLLSTRKKRITKAYLLQLKPFAIQLKVTKK